MDTFKRHRTLDELQVLCDAAGVVLKRDKYEKGSDYISVAFPEGRVMFNTFNGRFWGVHGPDDFNSDMDRPEPWYRALLNFFYTNEA